MSLLKDRLLVLPECLPPDGDTSIDVNELEQAKDYREVLQRYLRPIQQTSYQILWIGETNAMNITDGIEAVLDKAVIPTTTGQGDFSRWE